MTTPSVSEKYFLRRLRDAARAPQLTSQSAEASNG